MTAKREELRDSGIPEPLAVAATATAGVAGAAAGALAGAIAGPVGAVAGAVLGAVAGAAASIGIEEAEAIKDADDRKLDDAIGVTKGPIGAAMTTRPSLTGAPSSVGGAIHEAYDDSTIGIDE